MLLSLVLLLSMLMFWTWLLQLFLSRLLQQFRPGRRRLRCCRHCGHHCRDASPRSTPPRTSRAPWTLLSGFRSFFFSTWTLTFRGWSRSRVRPCRPQRGRETSCCWPAILAAGWRVGPTGRRCLSTSIGFQRSGFGVIKRFCHNCVRSKLRF